MSKLYRRGKTWWARIQVNGRDHRRSLQTTSRAVADRRFGQFLREAEHFRFHGETRHKWQDAVVQWSLATAGDLKATTRKRYLCSLKQLDSILHGLYIDEIDRRTVAKIAKRGGIKNATRRRDLTAVSVVLRWCSHQGWRDDNPARDWDRGAIKERRDPIALPSAAEIDLVINDCPGNFARLVRLALETGLRQEECGSLEHGQVDLKRRAIELSRTKGNRHRSVPLSNQAIGTYAGTPRHIRSPFVFWHHDGARYGNISSRFAAIVRRVIDRQIKANQQPLQAFRFHDLRHWYAVDYLRSGGSIYDLQRILGHASIKTTEIYLDFLTPAEETKAKRLGTIAGTGGTVSEPAGD